MFFAASVEPAAPLAASTPTTKPDRMETAAVAPRKPRRMLSTSHQSPSVVDHLGNLLDHRDVDPLTPATRSAVTQSNKKKFYTNIIHAPKAAQGNNSGRFFAEREVQHTLSLEDSIKVCYHNTLFPI
ncbi:hypothetical protein F442_04860 [Phytophthora nicotianae P10297]|uniref:Uncharacterized protein n=1 Tax=Phytophthora nicotianae P10297 TaxID=1317064 RepID=W2ZQL5_PHYNI|nr:hypothetical protein F442_04860 [Phytophthora nicotianae P10297]